ncbi:MAG: transposase [Candidatus Thiodiazotropha sp.]
MDDVFSELQGNDIIYIQVEHVSVDNTAVKVHQDGTGALKKTTRKRSVNHEPDGQLRFIMVATNEKTAVTFSLSPGQAGDAPEGRKLLKTLENHGWERTHVIMDKAYEGDETLQLVLDLEMIPVVHPKSNRLTKWEYEKRCIKSAMT